MFVLIYNAAIDVLGKGLLLLADMSLALPIAAILTSIQAGLALREAQLKNWRAHPLIRFAIEAFNALAAIAITTLFFLALTWPSLLVISLLLSVAYPVFVIGIGIRAIYNFGACIYYVHKSMNAENEEQQHKSIAKAVQHLLNGLAFGCITISVAGLLFPFAIPTTILVLALVGGVLGVCSLGYKLYETINHRGREYQPESSDVVLKLQDSSIYLCKRFTLILMVSIQPSPVQLGLLQPTKPSCIRS